MSDRQKGAVRVRTRRRPNKRFQQIFGKNLRERRNGLQLNQADLGERCGMHRAAICKLERGVVNVTLATLESLASGLGCTEEDLVRRPARRRR